MTEKKSSFSKALYMSNTILTAIDPILFNEGLFFFRFFVPGRTSLPAAFEERLQEIAEEDTITLRGNDKGLGVYVTGKVQIERLEMMLDLATQSKCKVVPYFPSHHFLRINFNQSNEHDPRLKDNFDVNSALSDFPEQTKAAAVYTPTNQYSRETTEEGDQERCTLYRFTSFVLFDRSVDEKLIIDSLKKATEDEPLVRMRLFPYRQSPTRNGSTGTSRPSNQSTNNKPNKTDKDKNNKDTDKQQTKKKQQSIKEKNNKKNKKENNNKDNDKNNNNDNNNNLDSSKVDKNVTKGDGKKNNAENKKVS